MILKSVLFDDARLFSVFFDLPFCSMTFDRVSEQRLHNFTFPSSPLLERGT